MEIISKSLAETAEIAEKFTEELEPLPDTATIVKLYGNLGAGKTTFAQAVSKKLGVKESVQSPTFVIEKIYRLTAERFETLIHIDAYRLESGSEIEKLGWQEIVSNPKNFILVEWPENIKEVIPESALSIYFEFVDENTRKIRL